MIDYVFSPLMAKAWGDGVNHSYYKNGNYFCQVSSSHQQSQTKHTSWEQLALLRGSSEVSLVLTGWSHRYRRYPVTKGHRVSPHSSTTDWQLMKLLRGAAKCLKKNSTSQDASLHPMKQSDLDDWVVVVLVETSLAQQTDNTHWLYSLSLYSW